MEGTHAKAARRRPPRSHKPWTAAIAGLVALTALGGCAAGRTRKLPVTPASQNAESESELQRLFNPPFALAVPEDAVVRIVTPGATCTGTLIEDDLILTAHHCMVERGAHGEYTKRVLDPERVKVELGGDYLAWGEVAPRAIIAPPCGTEGGAGDVAVLVLKRKLVGLSTMTARLDTPPKVGEVVDPMGFGKCALSGDGIKRRHREGGAIRALTGETIHLEASICPGDSGGPIIARGSREVLGVVSMAAMDADDKTKNRAVMARIDSYRLVFAHARLVADGLAPNELPPLECNGASPPK